MSPILLFIAQFERTLSYNEEMTASPPSLHLYLLGSPKITVNGQPTSLKRRKTVALLAYLAMTGFQHERESLAVLLWPELDGRRSQANLRHAIWEIKQALGSHWLQVENQQLQLQAGYSLDVADFLTAVSQIKNTAGQPANTFDQVALGAAVELVKDKFMAGFCLKDAAPFDDWLFFQAEHIHRKLVEVLQLLVTWHSAAEAWESAIQYGRRWLQADPLHEPSYVWLMSLYARSGQKAAALRQYDQCQKTLKEQLGIAPQLETTALYEKISRAQGVALIEAVQSVLSTPAQTQANKQLLLSWQEENSIPAPFQVIPDLPYFVGRAEEIATLKQHLLQKNHSNIYVISGMAGVGKTSLVAHLAYEVRDHFIDGVLWARVDISDTMTLLKLFADSYGQDVSQYPDLQSRSQAVRNILAHKQALLILDNVESSTQIQSLLPPNGPCATLVTTRHKDLRITRGHPHFHLEPFKKTSQYSTALFTKILGADMAKANQKSLVAIADLLGYLPLALAIMAGRIAYEPHATPSDYLTRLQEEKGRLNSLMHEDQSVQVSLNASYTALSVQEQRFFSALGLFSGEDFTLEVAAAITDVTTAVCRSHLTRLSSMSLIQAGKNMRYQLHPLLREYARSKISDSILYDSILNYYADYVENNIDNYRMLGEELDNIIGVLELTFARKEILIGVKLTINISQFLIRNGSQGLAISLLQRAEDVATYEKDWGNLALIKCILGRIEAVQNLHLAKTYFKEGLSLAYTSEDEIVIALALKDIGLFYNEQNNFEKAEAYWQKSLILARKMQQHKLLGFLLNNLASTNQNYAGDYQKSEELFLESIALQRQQNNLRALSLQLVNISMIAYSLGKYAQAESYIEESATIAHQIAYPLVKIILSRRRADLIIAQQGDYKKAQLILTGGERAARELGNDAATGFVLSSLGKVTARLGNFGQAVAYLEEAQQLAAKTNRPDIEIDCWTLFGYIATLQNDDHSAEIYFEKALLLARVERDVWFLCEVLEAYGEFKLARQGFDPAHALYSELLKISYQSKLPAFVGTAQFGLAQIDWANGNAGEAQRQAEESQSLFAKIGHCKADEVGAWFNRIITCLMLSKIEE